MSARARGREDKEHRRGGRCKASWLPGWLIGMFIGWVATRPNGFRRKVSKGDSLRYHLFIGKEDWESL